MTSDELRTAFLSFFESKGHKVIPSSSLIPHGDPTLLLTTAGVVQIKPYFLGEVQPPSPRLASCQKCFRTTDIESVGDASHLTFFEMLGNFSIGDYFKKEAIAWAWEFVTLHMKLPPERLWISIFLDDDEAFRHWREIGIPEERIVRLGEEDNFWGPAGDSGPCGPDSEIFYDFGEEVGCGKPTCAPGCDCGRYVEIWNLVFTQYNQDKNGKRTPLPKPNIDTGMGLERAITVVQGKTSVYETDLFTLLLKRISSLSGKKYGTDKDIDNAMRVVAEHSRGIPFLIADGVIPSNEGRGYVLRRLLRRAQYFGETLAPDKPFLVEAAKEVITKMKHVYPEIGQRQDFILEVIESEVEKFRETLLAGRGILNLTLITMRDELVEYFPKFEQEVKEALSKQRIEGKNSLSSGIKDAIIDFRRESPTLNHTLMIGGRNVIEETFEPVENELRVFEQILLDHDGLKPNAFAKLQNELQSKFEDIKKVVDSVVKRISGLELFVLHDTYGFPVELTKEIADEHGYTVDLAGFEEEMEKQRERARASHKFIIQEGGLTPEGFESLKQGISFKSEFIGYKNLSAITKIELINFGRESRLEQGQESSIVLSKTPFYGEMGGQVGDIGEIRSSAGRFLVTNTDRVLPEIIVHHGRVTEGSFSVGDEVEAKVDKERRLDIARNHTATHLLQAALKQVLGEHIQQRGSLVAPERFRFDFSHLVAMTKEEIERVQEFVNEKIRQNLSVYDEEMPYKKAIEAGTIALFDEKYGDVVRVLRIGTSAEGPISAELCGGTHASTTGEIGLFQIISESSVGAGLRRIEAVTGRSAEKYFNQRLLDLEKVTRYLDAKPDEVVNQAQSLSAELKDAHKQIQAMERELAKLRAESLVSQAETVNGIKVLAARVPPSRIKALREMSDLLNEKLKSVVIVLGTVYEDKPLFLATVTPDLVAKGYDAGKIIREVAKIAGGGGGGKATLAQAGGKDKSKLDEALKQVKKYIEGKES